MARIVSLLPAATDLVVALGRAGDLAGVTWECDVPEGVTPAVVTRDLLAADHDDPGAVDAAVRAASEALTPLAAVDEDAVAAIDPDVVLTQDLCRVCALPADAAEEAVARLGCTDATVVRLDPMTLPDVLACVTAVGAAIGAEAEATALLASLRERLVAVAGRSPLPVGDPGRPTAVVVEWTDPLFVGGHWIPELVEAAGATHVAGHPGGRSAAVDWSVLPDGLDHVVVAPCGYDLDGAAAQAEAVLDRVPAGAAVWAIDADALVVRPGPRVVEGVEVLAAAFAGRDVDPTRIRRIR